MRVVTWSKQRGDTLVEVMFSISILAVVISSTYAIANKSIQTSRLNYERNQALKYAESQIELYKTISTNLTKSEFATFQAQLGGTGANCLSTSLQIVSGPACMRDQRFTIQVAYVNSGRVETSYLDSKVIWDNTDPDGGKNVELIYRAHSEK